MCKLGNTIILRLSLHVENEKAALDLFQLRFKNHVSIHAFNRIAGYAWLICHGASSDAKILREG